MRVFLWKLLKKVGLSLTLLGVLGSTVAIPPPPPKVTYDYYVYNGTLGKVPFLPNFHGPFTYSGNVAGKQTTHVYGEGYGTST